jgi:hypothetical protein
VPPANQTDASRAAASNRLRLAKRATLDLQRAEARAMVSGSRSDVNAVSKPLAHQVPTSNGQSHQHTSQGPGSKQKQPRKQERSL